MLDEVEEVDELLDSETDELVLEELEKLVEPPGTAVVPEDELTLDEDVVLDDVLGPDGFLALDELDEPDEPELDGVVAPLLPITFKVTSLVV